MFYDAIARVSFHIFLTRKKKAVLPSHTSDISGATRVFSCMSSMLPFLSPSPHAPPLPNAMSQQHLNVFLSTVTGSSWQDQLLETQEASSGKYFNKTDSS